MTSTAGPSSKAELTESELAATKGIRLATRDSESLRAQRLSEEAADLLTFADRTV